MAHDPIPNPYDHELPDEEIAVGRKMCLVITIVFLLLLGGPPIWQELRELREPAGSRRFAAVDVYRAVAGADHAALPIAQRLRRLESDLEGRMLVAAPARQFAQDILLWFRVGNRKTIVGPGDWLFYRPERQALTGLGPLRAEPDSVAKDPSKLVWEAPLPAILDFANQLKARGITLFLVPVPMKESIYFPYTGAVPSGPAVHPDEAAFYAACQQGGVEVLSLTSLFWENRDGSREDWSLYLPTDTHWTVDGMRLAAEHVAATLNSRFPVAKATQFPQTTLERESLGDLVEKLDLSTPLRRYNATRQQLVSMPEAKSDPDSPIVLLGDSFVNIFHDPSLGFGGEDGKPMHAGFAQHLMSALGRSVDVMAINGGGASTVRERFAMRPDNVVRSKKAVIWVLAARDLFLARSEALANQVEWRNAKFNPAQTSQSPAEVHNTEKDQLTLEAMVLEISKFPANPKLSPYTDAVVSVKYRVEAVKSGRLEEKEIVVMHWLFKKREFLSTVKLTPGQRCRLSLVPWAESLEAYTKTLLDDFDALDSFFQESPEIMP